MNTRPVFERFWSKVLIGDGCWEWTATGHPRGYGYFFAKGRSLTYAHRWSYAFLVGEIPEGAVIDHLCRNTRCVRPDHLEAVTQKINVLRGEGLAAKQARRDTCIHGHPFDIVDHKGRYCSACRIVASRKSKIVARLKKSAAA